MRFFKHTFRWMFILTIIQITLFAQEIDHLNDSVYCSSPLQKNYTSTLPPAVANWKSVQNPLLSTADVWIKTKLYNNLPTDVSKVFYLPLTVVDCVDFFIADENGTILSHTKAGDTRPFSQLSFQSRYPAVIITLKSNEHLYLYTHAQSIGRIPLVIHETHYEDFFVKEQGESIWFGLFMGSIVIIFIYYLVLFIRTRKLYMIFNAFYVLSVTLYAIGLFHLVHFIIPDKLSLFYGEGLRGFLSLSYIFLGLFIYNFFKSHIKKSKNIFLLFFSLLLVHSLLNFYAFLYNPHLLVLADGISIVLHAPFILFLFIFTFKLSMKGNKTAYVLTFATGVTLFTVVFLGATILGKISLPMLLQNGMFAGTIIVDMICFVIAHQMFEEEALLKLHNSEKIIFEQSKRVAIGTMIGNISHQWQQPLGQISSLIMKYKATRFTSTHLSLDSLDGIFKKMEDVVTYLGKTISNFNDFFSVNNEKEDFQLHDAIHTSINLISEKLSLLHIKVDIEDIPYYTMVGSRNGIINIFLVILQNACENFDLNDHLENRTIKLSSFTNGDGVVVCVEDNGGGIKGDIDEIFSPFMSTKKSGSGSGLYIASWIMKESFYGYIVAGNTSEGAVFELHFPYFNDVCGVKRETRDSQYLV